MELDLRDTTILKGLAISAIVLHNFFHLVSPAHESEFGFRPGGLAVFVQTASHATDAVQAFFSFFGHYGVPVFIFLSAFGLAKRHWNDSETWMRFMLGRIRKLFPIFGLVILPWMIVVAWQIGPQPFLRTMVPQIAFMFTGLTPLVPGLDLPPVGPWWFIPFILEFYAIFFLIRNVTRRFGWLGLVLLALVGVGITAVANPSLAQWKINLYETPLGRMPSACFGIAAARCPFRFPASTPFIASAVLVLGCESAALWPFTFLAAAVLAVWTYMEFRSGLRESRILGRIGHYSIVIFLLNGIVRIPFLPLATTPGRQLLFGAISAGVCFVMSAVIQDALLSRKTAIRVQGTRLEAIKHETASQSNVTAISNCAKQKAH